MAFRIITGTMGSGKSYMGAELCVQYWKEQAVVHTNIDLVAEEVEARGWTEKTVQLGDNPEDWIPKIRRGREGQENLVVIDEGMLLFDAHDWQTTRKKHRQLMEFLIWSRKLGLDVYLIGQAQKGMDVAFTRMALETIACVACKTVPVVGPFLVTIKGDFLRIPKYPTGQRTGRKIWKRFDLAVGSIYRTESTHGKFEDVAQEVSRAPKNETTERRKLWLWVWGFALGLALAAWLIRRGWWQLFGAGSEPVLASQASAAAPAPPARVVTPELIEKAPEAAPAPKPKRFHVWGVSDLGKLQFWEAGTGVLVRVGEVYDEAVVTALQMSTRIYKVRLDDGRILSFRPARREDRPVVQSNETQPPWKLSSLGSIWPPSGHPSPQP